MNISHLFRRLLPRSLVWRVYALTSATLLLFVSLGVTLFYRYQFESRIGEVQDSASMMLEVAAQVVGESAVIGDYDTIKRTLDRTIVQPRFLSASFIDVKGGVLRSRNRRNSIPYAPDWLIQEVNSQLLDVNRPISVGGVDYGVLRLTFATEDVAADIWKLLLAAILLGFSSILGGLLLIWVPLKQWLGTMERVRVLEMDPSGADLVAELELVNEVPLEFRPLFDTLARTSGSLRHELKSRENAMASLKTLVETLLPMPYNTADSQAAQLDSLELISEKIRALVQEREADRKALDNQKFALDQHAIVSICDARGRITYANDKFCERAGYSRSELIGEGYSKLKSGVHSDAFYADIWQTVLKGKVWQGEICNHSRTGEELWFASTIVPFASTSGVITQFIGICTDISLMRRTKEALRKARDAAEEASRLKSGFLANMSHEIRTPMNGIIGMTDLVLESEVTETQKNHLMTVKSSADALLTIINDILDLSKIEAGKMALELIPFDLHALVQDVITLMKPKADQKGLECLIRIDEGVPNYVKGDPVRIRQILLNLVGNAIKFTPRGRVSVEVKPLPQADERPEEIPLSFSVTDTGVGISVEHQSHIFEPFNQQDISTTRKYGGTGLGLSISKRLVDLMKGHFEVQSRQSEGSVFTFVLNLPKCVSPLPAQQGVAGEKTPGSLNGQAIRVLLAEDNLVNQTLATALLTKLGCTVKVAENGALALVEFETNGADIVFMDMQMPVMDGLEATQEIRRLERVRGLPRTPIVAMTANAMQSDQRACMDAGMDDFIAKPVKKEQIREALERWAASLQNS
ncbi:MAG TPA: ATP-binding protein [Limnobacter sp.]|uniref:hybrid sensor histidine kinase/response regulator n=1 Tax=Limnobacter sp. TaxID=2003368 RepID=UPI002E3768AB|nr:ATP-binding protein [Limnobacter sp.]HEX5486364.1 ATP-binding protein [Limnobacter sp.]